MNLIKPEEPARGDASRAAPSDRVRRRAYWPECMSPLLNCFPIMRREGKHLPATGCNLSSRTLTSAVYRVAEISVNKKAPVCRSARNLISRDRTGKNPRVFATRTNRFALRRRNAGLARRASPASDPESRIAGIQMIHGQSWTTAWLMQSLRPINIRELEPERRGGDPRT